MSNLTDLDPRFADPENANGMADSWLAEGLRDWGYDLSTRQLTALWNLNTAAHMIAEGEHGAKAVEAIRTELAAFLVACGLRGPYYKPGDDTDDWWGLIRTASEALRDVRAWQRGGKGAAEAAFRVGLFAEELFRVALMPGQACTWNTAAAWHRGGETVKARTEEIHVEWERLAREKMKSDRRCKSGIEIARRVANDEDASRNPKGEPYNARVIYEHIKHLLK